MGIIEIFESRVPCLSDILDLQRTCQKQELKFSPDTNRYLLYLTLKKVGPFVAQKLVSKLVEKGEIKWDDDDNWEVERILDHVEEEGKDFYLIKWKGWSNAYNSWEPKDNLSCEDLLVEFKEFQAKGRKRRIVDSEDDLAPNPKRNRVDEIFHKLAPVRDTLSPIGLMSLSSPTKKGKRPVYRGINGNYGESRFIPRRAAAPGMKQLNPRSKFYKQKRIEVQRALKDWERHLNGINTDPAGIVVENLVDLEGPPENFVYINDYRSGEGITIPDDPIVGCECEDCHSSQKTCCPSQCGSMFAYYKKKRLRVMRGTPIYECNKRCKCGPECPNRVVQKGRKFKVCLFRTANGRGWGVKTLQKIKEGSFVIEYVGEVITDKEAERRGKQYDAVGRTYLFDLDYNPGDCPFTVDAGYYGNVSHFINHSCDPNLEVFAVWINTLDPRLPRIALFSKRDIEKGEELTFDYMMTGDTTNQAPTLDDVDITKQAKLLQASSAQSIEMPSSLENDDNTATEDEDTADDSQGLDTTMETETECDTADEKEKESSGSEQGGERMDLKRGEVKAPVTELAATGDAPTGNAGSTVAPVMKTPEKLLPKSVTDQYKIVCQCGAKNCRKYLF
ncbi:histone-lysine N-methyltransferase SUV39H2-like [Saccostrea cucullata]|uniref:histone-lysine N-methyltransferase SUV39H2-like n=1 Tax=Saccostrea cuccullata TaxID=36930 RepID=UPI002ED5C01D